MPCGEYFTSYTDRMGLVRWRIQWVALLLGIPIALALPFFFGQIPVLSQSLAIQIFIVAIAVLGLNIMVGYTGELVLAQGAFMGIGAYTTVNLINYDLGLLPSVFVGGLLAALVSLLAGMPSFRVKGYYVAISTLVIQFISDWFFASKETEWLTGGSQQIMPLESGLVGTSFPIRSGELVHYYLMFVILLLVVLATLNLSRSSVGRSMRAIRDNDLAANVLGLKVFRTKLTAYFLGGFIVGVAGGLWAFHLGIVQPGHFNFSVTISHYTILILGGLGYVWGALLGTVILLLFESTLLEFAPVAIDSLGLGIDVGGVRNMVFGALIIVVLVIEPKGVVSLLGQVKEYLRNWPYAY